MDKSKKQQYIIASTGALIGAIFIVTSLTTGVDNSGRIIMLIFGAFFGGAGILSFFSPIASEVLSQIMKNLSGEQKGNLKQKQNKPQNSPQTGKVYGGQTINYEKNEEKEEKYNKKKVKNRLIEIRKELNELKDKESNHEQGNKIFSPLKKEVRGIIHKIYPNKPEVAEKRLIHHVLWVITSSTKESDYQK